MKIIFLGTPQFAIPTLQKLLDHPDFDVIGVVTQPDKRRGRGNQLIPSPIKKIALEHGLTVWQPKNLKKARTTLSQLKEAQADAFVVVAYGQLLSSEILAMPKLGCINVHGSILPQYRGAAPIQWSIYHGDKETGITTMLMDEGMDTGAMLIKAYTPIHLLDNAHELAEKLAEQGADLLIETLQKLKLGDITATAQDNDQATYAPLIEKSDYVVDWTKSAIAIHNQIRAFYPNCVATFRNQSLKIMATIPLGDTYWEQLPEEFQKLQQQTTMLANIKGKTGEVVSIIKNFGAVIQTGEGLLLLKEVQLSGKRQQSGWDFVNGTRLEVGEIITS
ncbi:methionyl-tRNA formyltransferase [Rippkaea orientalis PCC 8801]|uniref:Methionyl-tRNA formyltransferase n=1 Tax=Rippkaea orientalis (strain PCC 8801 / RF-1) TaxID=41431 RepID=B7JUQ7_RIPO1|nr:methionyl-tRNA formyltransferase [Rippkaea orientalis]ACK65601.1 methionyl-tRNA formyltransferase [Rippkaea orientalis PCC 8801]